MAKVTVTIDVPGVSGDDLRRQVVLDDLWESGNDPDNTISIEHVKPYHVMAMFMQTCIGGGGSVGLYSGVIIEQEIDDATYAE